MVDMSVKPVPFLQEEEDAQQGKYLTFQLGKECFGIEIRHVTEIIGLQPITEIPELPGYVRGIINLRGKVIPIMDVRLRFRKPFREYDDRTCVIVVDVKEVSMGLVVDSVSEVLSIPDCHIVSPPDVAKASSKYVKALGKFEDGIKLLLDCDALLTDSDFDYLQELNK